MLIVADGDDDVVADDSHVVVADDGDVVAAVANFWVEGIAD